MSVPFVQPWTVYGNGETIEINGKIRTYLELRQQSYEDIIDELIFVSRASEGAVSVEWLEKQPVFIRKKYVEEFVKELEERQKQLSKSS